MWFECAQPFVGEERCVMRQKRLRMRLNNTRHKSLKQTVFLLNFLENT